MKIPKDASGNQIFIGYTVMTEDGVGEVTGIVGSKIMVRLVKNNRENKYAPKKVEVAFDGKL